jgi:hypothetical protein
MRISELPRRPPVIWRLAYFSQIHGFRFVITL